MERRSTDDCWLHVTEVETIEMSNGYSDEVTGAVRYMYVT